MSRSTIGMFRSTFGMSMSTIGMFRSTIGMFTTGTSTTIGIPEMINKITFVQIITTIIPGMITTLFEMLVIIININFIEMTVIFTILPVDESLDKSNFIDHF